MIGTGNNFITKVAEMRAAQRDYFKTRSPEALTRSKKLEKEVDTMLASITSPQKSMI